MGSPARPSEDDLIARHFAPLAGPAGLRLLDDAASLPAPPGCDLVVTVDAVVASVHFFPDDPADAIGWKALAVNLSDLAAKGAEPLGFVLALALPPDWSDDWLGRFTGGLGACAGAGACPLLGGDTVKTPGPLTIAVTAIGAVPAGRMVPRTGARPGDRLVVSGTIGDAALGLAARLDPAVPWLRAVGQGLDHLADRYLRPRARSMLAPLVLGHARGAMDVSDGLAGDLAKMMRVSGCGAMVDLGRVPLSDPARAALAAEPDLVATLMTGGDDYEILASVPPPALPDLLRHAAATGVPFVEVGEVRPLADGIQFLHNGQAVAFGRGSFSHF